ncbi:MAG: heme-binding domain-containing protein [Acidobacteria bacterium]|nr:heme-binding domain-containing protein [Acidobacteriota bacterium]
MTMNFSKGLLGAGIVALGIQLVPAGYRTNPNVDETRTLWARSGVTPEVRSILDRACADCHSNQTRWPWYSHVAPVSWWLADHVKDGRKELNLSDWQQVLDRGPQRTSKKLTGICNLVRKGKMPLKSYLLIHGNASLSPEDVNAVCAWTTAEKQRLLAFAPTVPASAK